MKKMLESFNRKALSLYCKGMALLRDKRGEMASGFLGTLIVSILIISLLVAGINRFFPGFFERMFATMESNLNAQWITPGRAG